MRQTHAAPRRRRPSRLVRWSGHGSLLSAVRRRLHAMRGARRSASCSLRTPGSQPRGAWTRCYRSRGQRRGASAERRRGRARGSRAGITSRSRSRRRSRKISATIRGRQRSGSTDRRGGERSSAAGRGSRRRLRRALYVSGSRMRSSCSQERATRALSTWLTITRMGSRLALWRGSWDSRSRRSIRSFASLTYAKRSNTSGST